MIEERGERAEQDEQVQGRKSLKDPHRRENDHASENHLSHELQRRERGAQARRWRREASVDDEKQEPCE